MKIPPKPRLEGTEGLEVEKNKLSRLREQAGKATTQGTQTPQNDQVQFSGVAKLLSTSVDAESFAKERQAKIAALKEQIANGTYKPSSIEVAQALAQELSEAISDGASWYEDEEVAN